MRFFTLLTCLLVTPFLLYADAAPQDWVGEYSMNHDGHLGTLRILTSQRKCVRPPCTGLDVQYVDEHGAQYPGSVNALDENGQHMAFTVDFPGNLQVFNVYIFSFDKSKIAGTTVWGGRTFGVLATKSGVKIGNGARLGSLIGARAAGTVSAGSGGDSVGGSGRTLLQDGSIERHYPDGTVHTKRIGSCGETIRYPDGRVVQVPCTRAAVITLFPPPPPTGSQEEKWLKAQDGELLTILQAVLGGANSTNFQHYQQSYENPVEPLLYKRVYFRTQALAELTYNAQ